MIFHREMESPDGAVRDCAVTFPMKFTRKSFIRAARRKRNIILQPICERNALISAFHQSQRLSLHSTFPSFVEDILKCNHPAMKYLMIQLHENTHWTAQKMKKKYWITMLPNFVLHSLLKPLKPQWAEFFRPSSFCCDLD